MRARSARRLRLLLVAYLALSLAIGWRLVTVQVLEADTYAELGMRQTQRELTLPAKRGRLLDRAGEPLAISVPAATIYANPRLLAESETGAEVAARELAPLLERDEADLLAALTRDTGFVYLGRQLPRAVGEEVTALALPGIGVLAEPRRAYPGDTLAAEVIGVAGVDDQGLSGLELALEELLSGTPGRMALERAPGGLIIGATPTELDPAVPGQDIVLTLDRSVQWAAEEALAGALEIYDAIGGSAVVIDVRSGEVLAMANVAAEDAAVRSGDPGYGFRNRVVTDQLEPGSVSKVVTAAAAIEAGVVSPGTPMTVPDRIALGGGVFSDSSPHETWQIDFTEVIARSSNVGTIQVADRLGKQRLHAAMTDFGYGQRTGVGFPGETGGVLHDVERWSATSLPTMAIGQGVTVTLLQVANVVATVANGGEAVSPHLVRGALAPDGSLTGRTDPDRTRVISEETAAQMRTILVEAVENGSGELAQVPGYTIAGKTGTAQKASRTARGYQEGAYLATFAGFAPAEDPVIAVAVVLDEPTPFYGGLSAAPTFAKIAGAALSHLRVPPSDAAARAESLPATEEQLEEPVDPGAVDHLD